MRPYIIYIIDTAVKRNVVLAICIEIRIIPTSPFIFIGIIVIIRIYDCLVIVRQIVKDAFFYLPMNLVYQFIRRAFVRLLIRRPAILITDANCCA